MNEILKYRIMRSLGELTIDDLLGILPKSIETYSMRMKYNGENFEVSYSFLGDSRWTLVCFENPNPVDALLNLLEWCFKSLNVQVKRDGKPYFYIKKKDDELI